MFKHVLVLPNGTEIYSGSNGSDAVMSVKITSLVNDSLEIMPGSVCASCVEATLFAQNGEISVNVGDEIRVYQLDSTNTRRLVGIFALEEPTRPTSHTMKLVGYDAVTKLDRDLTQWIAALDQWPYSVAEFANMVSSACDVTLEAEELPNGDFFVQAFTGDGITGRKLMQWIGQIAGRFCHATTNGNIKFSWYTANTKLAVAPTQTVGATWYYQNSLKYENFDTYPVEKVQIRQSGEDVGTVYPNIVGDRNTYVIENNPMLVAQNSTTLQTVAQNIYAQMQSISYTPGKVSIPSTSEINVGDIILITDANGKSFTFYVMKKTSDGRKDTLECTGSQRRDSSSAVNNTGYKALSGKVLNLRTDVDGIKAENKDTSGRLANVELSLSGIQTQVASQGTSLQDTAQKVSKFTQTAEQFAFELADLQENGTKKVQTATGYTFDDQGLKINRTDSQISNTMDHTGMYVKRAEEVILQANNQGVRAIDVTVNNYLIVGDNARFEDYGIGRTACFFIG